MGRSGDEGSEKEVMDEYPRMQIFQEADGSQGVGEHETV